jgi:NitT/TauT family transport system substrate-binding protein
MSVRRHHARNRLAALVIVGALVVISCGSDDDGAPSTPTTTSSSSGTSAPAGGGSEGPGSPAPQPLAERTSVTIVAPATIEAFAPAFLADAYDEFEKENLDASVEILTDFQASLAEMVNGRINLIVGGTSGGSFNAFHGGTDLRFLASVHQNARDSQEGLWVRNEFLTPEGELDPAKVPGMKVAISGGAGASTTLPVAEALEPIGASFEDLSLQQVEFSQMVTALETGALDGAYLLSPFWQQPAVADCCTLVTGQPPFSSSAYIMTGEAIDDDAEVSTAIMRALMRTVRTYLQGDYHADADVMATLAEALGQPVDALTRGPSMVFDPDFGFYVDVEALQDVWIEVGDILEYDEPVPASEIVDDSIIQTLLGE